MPDLGSSSLEKRLPGTECTEVWPPKPESPSGKFMGEHDIERVDAQRSRQGSGIGAAHRNAG